MTIDERLDRISRNIEFLTENAAKQDARVAALLESQHKNELLMADLMQAVMSHERRISNLERRP
jgi:hypothetical protein